jgi:uncharacterized protein with HEPN domain
MNARDIYAVESIIDHCDAIQKSIDRCNDSFEIFVNSESDQRSVSLSLSEIASLIQKFSENFKESVLHCAALRKVSVPRDHVMHGYQDDPEEIFNTATKDIPPLKAFCEEVLAGPQVFLLDIHCEEQ